MTVGLPWITSEVRQRSDETRRRRRDEAFWGMTDRSGECWVWTGARQTRTSPNAGGYGTIMRHGRIVYAHRHAYELATGPVPDGLEVMHSCDNPPCINPAHLLVGTHAENLRAAYARGRLNRPRDRGRFVKAIA